MDNKICNIHKEPALFCEQDDQQNILLLCQFCVQQRLKIQNINDVDYELQALQQLELKYDQSINQLKDFTVKLEQYIQQIKQQFKKFKQLVQQNLTNIIEQKKQVKIKSINFTTFQLNNTNKEDNRINNYFTQMKQQLNKLIKELEICDQLDQLYQQLNNLQIDVNYKENIQKSIQQTTVFNKQFDYQLMQQSSYKQNEYCCAIAFNKEYTKLIAGCNEFIKVFEFQDDQLREVQKLNGHSGYIFCLQFKKNSNQFISACKNSTIIIWEQNQNNQWQSSQILNGHTSYIYSIKMNKNEDMLISGAGDMKIQFWQKKNNTWSSIQSIHCENHVLSIILCDQEDILIASIFHQQILIIKLQEKEWKIKQKIKVKQYGLRLCFINSDQFVFQPYDRQHLLVFDYNAKDQIFEQGQKLKYSDKATDQNCLFPIRYISEIGLIMVKNDHYVHLIKRSQNGQLSVEQSINFGTYQLFGCITDDGKYIATWDEKSKEIQIRKFDF